MYHLKRLFLPTLFFALIFAVMPVIATQLSAPIRANSSALIGVGGELGTISDDGRYVAFESDSANLVPNDTNGLNDIFVYDRQTAQMTRVSVDSSGNQADSGSVFPSISADGRYVAFFSIATNLVANDTNGEGDTFVHDRQTGQTTRVSVDSSGNQANNRSQYSQISGNGQFVMFDSYATNLVLNDTNNQPDIFVHDRTTGQTTRVSVDSAGNQHQYPIPESFPTYANWISHDGRYVTFTSFADNLVAGNTGFIDDVFVHDRQTGQTTLVSMSSGGVAGNESSTIGVITNNGRYVAFLSVADNLVADDTNGLADVFLRDRQTNVTTRISLSSTGEQANNAVFGIAFASEDGRYVFFESYATNLTPSDTSGLTVGYIRDTQTNTTTRVSVDLANPESAYLAVYDISPDMRYVSFVTDKNLVSADTNNLADVYLLDRQTDTVSLISSAEDTRPTLNTPSNGASVTNPNVTFSWNGVASATEYQIQIATDSGFATIVHDHTLTVTSYAYTLPSIGTYHWRVRAINSGTPLQWSIVYQLSVAASEAPTLLAPINGMTSQNPSINFSWSPIAGATSYTLEISAFNDFSVVPAGYRIVTSNTTHPYMHNAHGTYYWRVRTTISGGNNPWSETRQFTLEPLPQPSLIAPVTGSNVVPIHREYVNFDWSTVSNPTPHTLNYHLQMATDENFNTLVFSGNRIPNRSFPIFGDQTVATYYWRVCARIGTIPCTTWSNVFEFTVQPMVQDIIFGPEDGYTAHYPVILFEIDILNDGAYMDRVIQVALDSDFTNLVEESDILSDTIYRNFPPNIYYWRIGKSQNWVGDLYRVNSWSETRQFTIQQYDTPILVSLDDNEIHYSQIRAGYNLYFEWLPSVTSDHYEFQLSADSTFDNLLIKYITDDTFVDTSTSPNYDYQNLLTYGVYYWRVRAVYAAIPDINFSEWSEVRSFSMVNYNLNRGVTSWVSDGKPSDISADGRYIVVIIPLRGLFVRDRVTNQLSRVDVNSQGIAADYASTRASISDNGRYVVFISSATNLVADDSGSWRDVFLRDRQTRQTRRISVNAQGIEGNQNSLDATISSDGRYVVFTSEATNLVPNDTNGVQDIFLYDTQTGQMTLVSASSEGVIGNNTSYYPSISNDGRYVLFMSQATNLVASDTDTNHDIYIKDMQTGQLTLESLNHAGDKLTEAGFARISGNGNYIVFVSDDVNVSLVRYYTAGVYVRNRQTGQVIPASIPYYPPPVGQINGIYFYNASISDDGRYVVFEASDSNVTPDNPFNDMGSVFRHDTLTGETLRMSISTDGIVANGKSSFSGYNSISGDGTSGVFFSGATNLTAPHPNDDETLFMELDTFVIQFKASKPALVSPTDRALTVAQNVTFNWSASVSATQYQIQIASDSAFTNVLHDVNQTTITYAQTLTPNTYYWRVRGKSSLGDGPWSDTYQFQIGIGENVMLDEQQLFTMAQSRLTDGMTFALFDITPTGIITTVQFNDGGVVTGTVNLSVTNGLMTIMVEGVSGGSAEQQMAMYDVVPSLIMAMFDETLPDDYVLIESLTLTDVGISANLLMPNNP